MEDLGKIHQLIVNLSGYEMTFNLDILVLSWIVIIGLLVFGYFASRNRQLVPGAVQTIGETFVFQFYSLTEDALGERLARKYGPLIIALFMFLLMCNWLGVFPHLGEPTSDLNTTLAMGIMGFVIAHYVGIREKGIKAYLKGYCEPIFFMIPLNIIGELSKVISISFRLFGNIMGGDIIVLVVTYLTFSLVLPPFLTAFFFLFIGAIQAFVFTMLTLVYIAVQVH
ncbi:MAG: F0F1 ATP synthase subunit A [Desulfobacteraceae bacterium]|nr:F0F1 ATP synthase subunit A [Desulfobacteraceae bacterium]